MQKYIKTSKYKYLKEFEQTREDEIQQLKDFLSNEGIQKFYEMPIPIQAFTTKNIANDRTIRIFNKYGITIEYCYTYDYIEIFGITGDEYIELLNEGLIY